LKNSLIVNPQKLDRDTYQAPAHRSTRPALLSIGLNQIGDMNGAQQILDTVVHLPQWFFDGAGAR
jgi:hypothetical protein